MVKSKNIFLIGPMGAGKTTIGRQLAKKLSSQFYDSDYEIEQRTGADIPLIFELEGEEGFRKRETQVIEELVSLKNIILSTGGGSVLSPVNRKALEDNGTIIYLKSTAEKLFKRTAEDKRRPLLQTEDRLGQIKKILSEREPYYLSMADEIIDTHDLGIKQIINKILKLIETNESN
ncbi:MAG TPA: shikimate kinase AroK [Gammaproteobacteria bacterium]|nr:shikimate kinase AroK [Gammaproteobacteria bacterium]